MTNWTWRALYSVCGVAALLATPAESQGCAFLNRLFGCGGCGPQTSYMPVTSYYAPAAPACTSCSYAPAVSYYAPAPASSPCATGCAPCLSSPTYGGSGYAPAAATSGCSTCTASYAPTYYRPVVTSVATTTYRPVVSYNPWNGYAQTSYRPVNVFRPQINLVANPSYQASYAPATNYTTISYVAPASTCNTYTSSPAVITPSPTPATMGAPSQPATTVTPATSGDPADVRPSTSNREPTPAQPQTFEPTAGPELSFPANGQPRRTSTQSIIAPPAERQTLREVPLTARVNFASQATSRPLNAGGWEAAD